MTVVICGAGIAGLTLALRMDALGWEVVVLEKAPGPRTQGYMIDFFGPGYDTAESLGVLPRLHELGYQIEAVTYLDDQGRQRGSLSMEQFTKLLDGRLVSIMRPDLELALRESLPDRVDLRYSTSLTEVVDTGSGVRLALTDGSSVDADLLVGADGIHSTVRRLVFGEESRYLHYLGLHTAAYVFDDATIHGETTGRFCLTDTIRRQVGFYGLRTGQVACFCVHRTPDPRLPADPAAEIRQVYAQLGWLVPRALEQVPAAEAVYYDQVAQIRMPRWSSGRVVLIGDACHAVSLLAGQGASLGMAGAYVLAEQLAGADASAVPVALRAYEDVWRPVVTEKQRVARSTARWFLPNSSVRLHMRRLVMRLSGLPFLSRFVANGLMGKPSTLVQQLSSAKSQPNRSSGRGAKNRSGSTYP